MPAQPASTERGFSLLEALIACTVLTAGVVSLAQLFTLAAAQNLSSRTRTLATILAAQKLEELRSLPVSNEPSVRGAALSPSPPATLTQNVAGYADVISGSGATSGAGDAMSPGSALFTRRWAIEPLAADPEHTLVIHVRVLRYTSASRDDDGPPGWDVRLVTARTRRDP